jgi:F420-non-reducing hydrogenase iron-sulfur subunit
MLDQFGIERGRVRLEWVSASEGEKYARVVESMTEEIRALGPLNWKGRLEVLA